MAGLRHGGLRASRLIMRTWPPKISPVPRLADLPPRSAIRGEISRRAVEMAGRDLRPCDSYQPLDFLDDAARRGIHGPKDRACPDRVTQHRVERRLIAEVVFIGAFAVDHLVFPAGQDALDHFLKGEFARRTRAAGEDR